MGLRHVYIVWIVLWLRFILPLLLLQSFLFFLQRCRLRRAFLCRVLGFGVVRGYALLRLLLLRLLGGFLLRFLLVVRPQQGYPEKQSSHQHG